MRATTFDSRKRRPQSRRRAAASMGMRLGKASSKMFCDRRPSVVVRLELGHFDHVREVDTDKDLVDAAGMTRQGSLRLFDQGLCRRLKHSYTPDGSLGNLRERCVRRC